MRHKLKFTFKTINRVKTEMFLPEFINTKDNEYSWERIHYCRELVCGDYLEMHDILRRAMTLGGCHEEYWVHLSAENLDLSVKNISKEEMLNFRVVLSFFLMNVGIKDFYVENNTSNIILRGGIFNEGIISLILKIIRDEDLIKYICNYTITKHPEEIFGVYFYSTGRDERTDIFRRRLEFAKAFNKVLLKERSEENQFVGLYMLLVTYDPAYTYLRTYHAETSGVAEMTRGILDRDYIYLAGILEKNPEWKETFPDIADLIRERACFLHDMVDPPTEKKV
jgi:hypothetical protein